MTSGPPSWLEELKLAEAHATAGRLADSEAVLRQILKADPNQADALNALAAIAASVGKLDVAITLQERAVAARPNAPHLRSNLAEMYRRAGRNLEAIEQGERAVALKADFAVGRNTLGVAYESAGDLKAALACYDAALTLQPAYVEAHVNRGRTLRTLGQLDESQAALQRALELSPDRPDVANELGLMLSKAGRKNEAVELLERAARNSPYADVWNNLGTALKEVGRFDDALMAFDRASGLDPQSAASLFGLSEVKTFRDDADEHLKRMEAMAANRAALPLQQRIYLHFALGKAYDDLGRTDEAFAQWSNGNALKRESEFYDEAAALGLFGRVKEVFGKEFVSRPRVSDEERTPIFVIGMPRSGTTLVEQIISTHPDVGAAGEISAMNDLVRRIGDFPESARALDDGGFARAGQDYVSKLRTHAPSAAQITDKTPSNMYMIGLIHLMLPNATVVHVRRDPVDTCFSCYSKLFTREMGQTYDLASLGRYYQAYHDLMRHWDEALPEGRLLSVRYEDVVADIEGQARRLLAHCGLPWDERVLAFHESGRAVSTASASQVRQPIYNTSVARWRRYEAHLGPLLETLGDLVES